MHYPAREAYRGEQATTYDRERTRSILGRLEWKREFQTLEEFLASVIDPRSKILDAPTGTGRFLPLLHDRGHEIASLDISSDMLNLARQRMGWDGVELILGDCEFLPFPTGMFDYVLSVRYLGHLPPPVRLRVLKEFRRVCRKGLIVGFPILTFLTRLKFILGNALYRIRTKKSRQWWPATPSTLSQELAAAGLVLRRKQWVIWPISQIALLYLEPYDRHSGTL